MSNMVIKPAAWLRSNQALQSAKNNVRRVLGSDGDSFSASAGARAPALSAASSPCSLVARGPAGRAPPVLQAERRASRAPRTPGLSSAADSRAPAVRHRVAASYKKTKTKTTKTISRS